MSAGSITWVEALEQRVRNVLASDDLDGLRMLLANRHPAAIAEVIDRLDDDDKIRLFRLLPPRQAADVLGETSADATRELLEQLPAEEVGDLLDSLPVVGDGRMLGIDPAVVSAPLITTLVDATGLAIYLLIAKALLGL